MLIDNEVISFNGGGEVIKLPYLDNNLNCFHLMPFPLVISIFSQVKGEQDDYIYCKIDEATLLLSKSVEG